VSDPLYSARAFAHCSCRVIPRLWVPFLPKCTKWNERNNNSCSNISSVWPYHSSYSYSLLCTWCCHPYWLLMQQHLMFRYNMYLSHIILHHHKITSLCLCAGVLDTFQFRSVCYLEFGKFSNNLHYVDYERLPIEEFSENGGSIPHNVGAHLCFQVLFAKGLW
jgi:hypothetical protein